MKSRLLGLFAACGLLAVSAAAAGTGRLTPEQVIAAEKAGGPAPVAITASRAATVTYPGTLAVPPTFNRPLNCASLSGVGSAVAYSAQVFDVDTAGSYTLTVLSTEPAGLDTVLALYQGSFDPASPLTNCVAVNDDATGISPLSRITQALNAGTPYVLVTTTFSNGVVGSFTNEIPGPGNISLVGAGPSANLGITKSAPDGVVSGGSFVYRLVASNAGPDDATGVTVSDPLPAGLSFVSSTCGATAAGSTVTWSIGALANGASASCDLTVQRAATTCSAVSNTASISGDQPDPVSSNNSGTHSNGGGNLVADASFEAGTGAGSPWTQASSNFGSPLCTVADCGTGGGSAGPQTGDWWVWFGGTAEPEAASVQQSLGFATGADTLEFGYRLGLCGDGAGAGHFVRVLIDGTEVWRRDASSAECGAASYSTASIDVSSFATGATRTLRIESETNGGSTSNFSIDDVRLLSAPTCVAPASADLALTQTFGATGVLGLGSPLPINLVASNGGPGAAASVAVSTTLPGQLEFVGSTCGATAVGNVVSWSVGALANGASASCTLNTSLVGTGGFSVSSTIASATSDPVSANNSATGSLGGVPASNRPAVVPTLDRFGLIALVLAVLAVAGFSLGRRPG